MTPESSPSDPVDPVLGPSPGAVTTRGRHPRRGPLVAVITAVAVIAVSAVGVALTRDDDRADGPLRLRLLAPGGSAGPEAAASDLSMPAMSLKWQLDGPLADLGRDAAVYAFESRDDLADRVPAWANALGIDGEVVALGSDGMSGWEVHDSDQMLTVVDRPMATFSYQRGPISDAVAPDRGSGAAGGSDGSDGSGATTPPEPLRTTVPDGAGSPPALGDADLSPDGTLSVDPGPAGCTAARVVGGDAVAEPCGTSVEPSTATPVALPSDAEARSIAEAKLRDLGLLDGDWAIATVPGGGGVTASATCTADGACTPVEEVILSRLVSATPRVEGSDVPGLAWYVTVGDQGRVDAISGSVGALRDAGRAALRSPADAFADVESGAGFVQPLAAAESSAVSAMPECGPAVDCAPLPCPTSGCEIPVVTVTVTGVSIVHDLWYGGDPDRPTQFVVPMYRFVGRGSDGQEHSADVLALTDDALAPRPDPSAPIEPAPAPAPPAVTDPGAVPVPGASARSEPESAP